MIKELISPRMRFLGRKKSVRYAFNLLNAYKLTFFLIGDFTAVLSEVNNRTYVAVVEKMYKPISIMFIQSLPSHFWILYFFRDYSLLSFSNLFIPSFMLVFYLRELSRYIFYRFVHHSSSWFTPSSMCICLNFLRRNLSF